MSDNLTAQQQCYECGHHVAKIHRVYQSHRYCHTCYIRVFVKRPCPSCGIATRLPNFNDNAVCQRCETDKPCIRCQRSGRPLGKITIYGIVCNSCAVHFREPSPCELCGGLSKRLTRVTRFGDGLRVCTKCSTRDYQTCPLCRRYRKLEMNANGQELCKLCITIGSVECIQCGSSTPAGLGKQCESCNWLMTLKRRVAISQNLFLVSEMKRLFEQYADWLVLNVGSHKAALLINRHTGFFEELEKNWTGMLPTYSQLLQYIRPSGARKYELPMRWLQQEHQIQVDQQLKSDLSEQDQLDQLMSTFPESVLAWKVLNHYRQDMCQRVLLGKTNLRSVRMAIKPAVAIFNLADQSGQTLPDSTTVKNYLNLVPGQLAALTGFVNFLNSFYGAQLQLNAIAAESNQRNRILRKVEKSLLEMLTGTEHQVDDLTWVRLCLQFFHGVSAQVSKRVKLGMFKEASDGGINVDLLGQVYWIPNKI